MAETGAAAAGERKEEEEEEEVTIHGDVLEAVLSHTPLINLLPAVSVSKDWNKAVYSSLRSLNPIKPWLLIHRQRRRSPYTIATSAHAYDPRSNVWMNVSQPSTVSFDHASTLRSSTSTSFHSNLLLMLSSSKFSYSLDPLNLTWHHVDAPSVSRLEPIVAKVGDSIVVAGGGWNFESDPLAVEIYDIDKRQWRNPIFSDSMPSSLKDVATSSFWLSAAASPSSSSSSEKLLYVMNKLSGEMHVFDVKSSDWSDQPCTIRPDPRCFYSVIGFINDDRNLMILVGMISNGADIVEKVKIWEVRCDDFTCKDIGEMPPELADKIIDRSGESFGSGIEICSAGNFVYVYNPTNVKEVVVCEFDVNGGGGCRWGSVRTFPCDDSCGLDMLVLTCAEVNIEDLQRATTMNGRRYNVVRVED